jgi:polypyrimidine tract-binding protein 2
VLYRPCEAEPEEAESNSIFNFDSFKQPLFTQQSQEPHQGIPYDQQQSKVLLVSNLPTSLENACTPHTLFQLFGMYGNVSKVKIMYNQRERALIEFEKPEQAIIAKTHLNKVSLYGNQISISFSKHQSIAIKDDKESSLSQDFS